MSENMANEHFRSSDVGDAQLLRGYKKTEAEPTASGSGVWLPEADADKPETETSDGDQQRRHRRRRKYGRLKRIRLEGLALPVPVDDAATESESERHFIVVDPPLMGNSQLTTSTDGKDRPWFRRMLTKRDRNWTFKTSNARSKPLTTTAMPGQRCERYFKQFVAALFSTVGLLCLMVGYTVLGGYVFCRLESSNEVTVKADLQQVNLHSGAYSLKKKWVDTWTTVFEFEHNLRESFLTKCMFCREFHCRHLLKSV